MAARTVRRGAIVYRDIEGKAQTGWYGDEVDVHEDDLERFDQYNGAEPASDAGASSENSGTPGESFEPYKGVTVPDLKAEIDKRNEGREDADKVAPKEPGNRPELVAALVADDAKQQD